VRNLSVACRNFRFALAAGLCVLLFALHAPVANADDLRTLRREYEAAKKEGAFTRLNRLATQIGSLNNAEACRFLLRELEDDQRNRARNRPALPGRVRETLIRVLGGFTDEPSVELIGNAALSLRSMQNPELALDQLDYLLALAQMDEIDAADAALRAAIAEPRNAYLKVAAIEAVRQAGAARFVPDVTAVLREQNEDWARRWLIVPINVFTCLHDIVDASDTELVLSVVEAVIEWEERKLTSDERVRHFGGRMLRRLTGEQADMGSTAYWKWWVQLIRSGGDPNSEQRPEGGQSRTAAASRPVFDTQVVGQRIVLVIDVSHSMKMPLKIDLEEIERRRRIRERPPATGRRQPGQQREEEDPARAEDPLHRLPWKDIKTKMDLAREELSRAILDMTGDRWFAVVTYSTGHENLTDGWVRATEANCRHWSQKVRELETDALTNIHGALMRALRINDKGETRGHPAVDPDCVLSGADTIVFMTDGWGSWDDHSSTLVTDRRNNVERSVGDGPYIYGEEIWPDVMRHNAFRKVVINTVGIGFHDKELMTQLARRTGGTYVDWGFPEK
jgi:hypothetical protein